MTGIRLPDLRPILCLAGIEAFFDGHGVVTLHNTGTCLKRLKAEAARWRKAHDKIIAYAADVEAKAKESIAEVAAENAELREDKARLDWLEATDGVKAVGLGGGPWIAYRYPLYKQQKFSSIRAAIDAARKEPR